MSRVAVVFFRDADGNVPVKDWLDTFVAKRGVEALAKCRVKLAYLANTGRDARRPHVDYLRNGIYELRARHRNANYRILFFYGSEVVAVAAHGLTKEATIPQQDIDIAIERKKIYEANTERHTCL